MKKRILALLLSASMVVSGTGTAFAAEEGSFADGLETEEELEISGEDQYEDSDDGEEFEEADESEEIEVTDDNNDEDEEIELLMDEAGEESSEDAQTESPVEDTVFPTGLNLEGTEHEIIKGDEVDEAEFEAAYDSYYVTPNLPPLRDQYPYGTCWAFATTALAEINLMKSGKMSKPDLSELHLAYFAYNPVTDPLGGTAGDTATYRDNTLLNYGGNVELAYSTLAKWTGAASESTVPYSMGAQAQSSGLDKSLAYKDQIHIEDALVTEVDMNTFRTRKDISMLNPIKKMVTEYGSAAMYFGAVNSMQGVTDNKIYSTQYKSYYNPNYIQPNHAVVIVGWDDNFSRYNFARTAPGNGAFLIRNSWNTKGSTKQLDYTGYFWMSYYEASINSDFYAVKAAFADNYDNNYQYDGFSNGAYGYVNKGANVFTVHSPNSPKGEFLEAVSFYSLAENTRYKIEIYKDVKDTPGSGTLYSSCTTTGTIDFSGYHTVKLNSPVLLRTGSKFAVVVTIDAGGLMYDANEKKSWYTVSSNAGESYYNTGSRWVSLGSNLRIKAYTEDVEAPIDDEPEKPTESALESITLSKRVSGRQKPEGGWEFITTIKPIYNPYDYKPKGKIVFTSSKPKVATIDSEGVLTYHSAGTTTITATVDGVSGTIDIVVEPWEVPDPDDDDPGKVDPEDPSEDKSSWGDVKDEEIRKFFDNDPSRIPDGAWYVIDDDDIFTPDDDSDKVFYEPAYTGKKVTFNDKICVYKGNKKLSYNKDYTVTYANNVAVTKPGVKQPKFTVKSKNKSFASRTFYFDIDKAPMSRAFIASDFVVAVKRGNKKLSSIKPKVTFGGKTLKAGKDYRLEYTYKGSVIGNPSLVKLDTADTEFKINIIATENGNFEGEILEPVTVTVFDPYDMYYVPASKLKVKGADGKALKFEYCSITPKTQIREMFKEGKAVVYYQNEVLEYGMDYDIAEPEYDYTTVGTHKIYLVGLDGSRHFKGSKTISFKVTPYNFTAHAEDYPGRLDIEVPYVEYKGKAVVPDTRVYFLDADENFIELVKGVDYTITYKNNKAVRDSDDPNPPMAVVKGKGRFTGTAFETFSIDSLYLEEDD